MSFTCVIVMYILWYTNGSLIYRFVLLSHKKIPCTRWFKTKRIFSAILEIGSSVKMKAGFESPETCLPGADRSLPHPPPSFFSNGHPLCMDFLKFFKHKTLSFVNLNFRLINIFLCVCNVLETMAAGRHW